MLLPSLLQRVPVASVGAVAHSPAKALPPAPAPQAMLPSFSEDASPALSKRAQSVARTPLKKVQLSKPAASPTPSSSSSLSSSSSSVDSVVPDEAPDPLVALVEPVDEDLIEFEPILPVHHAAERSAKRSRAPDVEEEVVDPEFDQEEESLWSNRSSLSNIMDGLQESFAGISPTGQIALKLLKERVKTDEKLLELGIREGETAGETGGADEKCIVHSEEGRIRRWKRRERTPWSSKETCDRRAYATRMLFGVPEAGCTCHRR